MSGLKAIEEDGSILDRAKALDMSYRAGRSKRLKNIPDISGPSKKGRRFMEEDRQ